MEKGVIDYFPLTTQYLLSSSGITVMTEWNWASLIIQLRFPGYNIMDMGIIYTDYVIDYDQMLNMDWKITSIRGEKNNT